MPSTCSYFWVCFEAKMLLEQSVCYLTEEALPSSLQLGVESGWPRTRYIIHKTICGWMDDNLSCGINSSTSKLDSFANNPNSKDICVNISK
jgi:hypothetical protein